MLAKGFDLEGAPLAPVEIILAANGGALRAAVANEKGDPIPEALVLLPDPPRCSQRALGGDCATEASGGCSIRGIAPGEYHAFAFIGNSWPNPDETTIKEIEKYGKSVTIAAGAPAR